MRELRCCNRVIPLCDPRNVSRPVCACEGRAHEDSRASEEPCSRTMELAFEL